MRTYSESPSTVPKVLPRKKSSLAARYRKTTTMLILPVTKASNKPRWNIIYKQTYG